MKSKFFLLALVAAVIISISLFATSQEEKAQNPQQVIIWLVQQVLALWDTTDDLQNQIDDLRNQIIPAGSIVMWSGSIVDIPDGWALCDGTQGTPDLRDKFILGAGNTYNPGDTGGSATHTHTVPNHTHDLSKSMTRVPFGDEDYVLTDVFIDETAIGETSTASNLPPYYALAFIMKLEIILR